MLSSLLKGGGSLGSIPNSSFMSAASLSRSAQLETPDLDDLDGSFVYDDETSSPAASSPLGLSAHEQRGRDAGGDADAADAGAGDVAAPHLDAAQGHYYAPGPRASPLSSAAGAAAPWDMQIPAPIVAARAAAAVARSMPRPIGGVRRTHSAAAAHAAADDAFVPPHLAASSMIETQSAWPESISTAKGPAALRMRSTTLRRTGYLDGRLCHGGAPARMPGS